MRGGGVRVKRGSSESDSLSDGESGGEEGKRKRLHRTTEQERRSVSVLFIRLLWKIVMYIP